MKISETIENLQNLLVEYGDLEVLNSDDNSCNFDSYVVEGGPAINKFNPVTRQKISSEYPYGKLVIIPQFGTILSKEETFNYIQEMVLNKDYQLLATNDYCQDWQEIYASDHDAVFFTVDEVINIKKYKHFLLTSERLKDVVLYILGGEDKYCLYR